MNEGKRSVSLIESVEILLEYMWKDELKDYKDTEFKENHVFVALKKLRDEFGLSESFHCQ